MFISEAFAQTTGALGGDSYTSIIFQLVAIFIIFYLLLIRPQQKRYKQHTLMLNAVKKGDKVVTGGGIFGKVVNAEGEELVIEIAPQVNITVLRASIKEVIDTNAKKTPANTNTKGKK
ncbi:MAG: preprotein translocase subunit YajC [Lactobacillus sp.]|nr:preprotein translocase subunit YajC [Lactobacillus sp.]